MTRDEVLAKLRELKPWLESQGIGRVRLFGSYARNEPGPDSDIDLIVELTRPMGFDYFRIERELSEKLGAPVEMSTESSLHRIVLRHALAEAIDA